jgi:hypothetical protein
MPKRLCHVFIFAVALAFLAAPRAEARDLKGGVRFGYYADIGEPFAGAELLLGLGDQFYFNPNIEFVFRGDSYITFNTDFHYDFYTARNTTLWAGAGLAVINVNPEGDGGGDTDAGLDLLLGIGFPHDRLVPYLQTKVIVKDDTELVLSAGLRF